MNSRHTARGRCCWDWFGHTRLQVQKLSQLEISLEPEHRATVANLELLEDGFRGGLNRFRGVITVLSEPAKRALSPHLVTR